MHQGDGLLGGRQRWRRAGPLSAPHPGDEDKGSLTGAHPQLKTQHLTLITPLLIHNTNMTIVAGHFS